jgi:hypothetical protein
MHRLSRTSNGCKTETGLLADLEVHSQLSDSIAFEAENAAQNIDVQFLSARTRKVDRRGIRRVIVDARDLSVASELSCNHFGFGFGAEKISVDRQVRPLECGQFDL